MAPPSVHATCVALDGFGALFRGPSGAGKSDLALRLIDQGAQLVADDQVVLRRMEGRVMAEPPAVLAGRIEVRGIGIVALPWIAPVPLAAIFDLGETKPIPRLPELRTARIAGLMLPLFALAPFESSAPAKVRIALRLARAYIEDHGSERPSGRIPHIQTPA